MKNKKNSGAVAEKILPPQLIDQSTPLIALLGRPNVGKSTLFNRLCGGFDALVHDMPGVTRDRRYGRSEYDGYDFRVVDTGGVEMHVRGGMIKEVVGQAEKALDEAAIVLFVLDAQDGLLPVDEEIAQWLRKTGKVVFYVINKIDGYSIERFIPAFSGLGTDKIFGVSASHGRGMSDLLEAIIAELRKKFPKEAQTAPAEEDNRIRVALVGRPNVGKSSILNQLVGDERAIVSDIPGTTRDPIDTELLFQGRTYVLVDTAGIRKRARVHEAVEKISVKMSEKAIERADVVILVIDVSEGISEQDAKIAGLVQEMGRGLILAFNKSDLVKPEEVIKRQKERERILQFVPWALQVSCSAIKGKNVTKLLLEAANVYESYTKRVSTGALNRFFAGIVEKHPPPLHQGHPIRLYYITQAQTKPPTFVLSVNHPQGMHFSYRRYLQNQIRETFGFIGTPIRLIAKGSHESS